MALSVLFVAGTGQISLTSVREAVAAGHKVTEGLDEILAEPMARAKLDLKMPRDDGHPNQLGGLAENEDTLMARIIADQSALGCH